MTEKIVVAKDALTMTISDSFIYLKFSFKTGFSSRQGF